MTTTPISEEANDIDHETSDQVTTEPRRSTRVRPAPEWYGNPILEVMLLDHDEPTNYEEVMMSPDSAKWLDDKDRTSWRDPIYSCGPNFHGTPPPAVVTSHPRTRCT